MVPVEILPFQENIILRARGSELLIHSIHVKKLQDLKKPRDFSQYFRAEALVNRPARKLFEAWLRKDHTLWPRLYKAVHGLSLSSESSLPLPDPETKDGRSFGEEPITETLGTNRVTSTLGDSDSKIAKKS